MTTERTLDTLLAASADRFPGRVAVVDPTGATISYAEIRALSAGVAARLAALGVAPGDRVGLDLRKSIDAVAAIFGILEAGAAYVPVDPYAPSARSAYILEDCGVKALFVEEPRREALLAEFAKTGFSPAVIALPEVGTGAALREAAAAGGPPAAARGPAGWDELAYILYTSGSTGKPKGVMLTHKNAVSYVDWCGDVFRPSEDDRFANHAPLHFDISILDLFVSIDHGAALVLIGEETGKDPVALAETIARQRVTIWYSAPSILGLLAQFGKLERHDASSLRLVLFAGEVFPIKHLRALKARWRGPRYFNLYGPTETNVCTFFEVPAEIPADRAAPYPIGKACSHFQTRVAADSGAPLPAGDEGELCAAGLGLMRGYWNRPEDDARVFFDEPDGTRWYRTGDVVREDESGDYLFVGRRDRMVKRRGYRIELAEVEAGLYRHPDVAEAAAISLPDADGGVRIKGFLVCREGKRPTTIQLKQFCAENLPGYMIPDLFAVLEQLPKTSTGKVDYQKLKAGP